MSGRGDSGALGKVKGRRSWSNEEKPTIQNEMTAPRTADRLWPDGPDKALATAAAVCRTSEPCSCPRA